MNIVWLSHSLHFGSYGIHCRLRDEAESSKLKAKERGDRSQDKDKGNGL